MVFKKQDPRDRIIFVITELELELRTINSLYNKLQRDLECTLAFKPIVRDIVKCNNNSNNNAGNVDNDNDITAVLTLLKTVEILLQNITIRMNTLIYMQEMLSLLERVMKILSSIRPDIKKVNYAMYEMMRNIDTSFIESKIEFGYSNRIELPMIDNSYSIESDIRLERELPSIINNSDITAEQSNKSNAAVVDIQQLQKKNYQHKQ